MKRLLLVGLLALSPVAWATDYYVRTDGNDGNTGTANTSGGAWATVKKCAQTAAAGDRCLIQPGTYNAEGASWSQTNAGTLESNNLLTNCTCTNGTNTITCGSAIPGTVAAGDFVQCDSGNGFSWSRVQSVASSTITLGEPYRGVTSTNPGADTLDVANFIEIIGDGASESIIVSKWQPQPGSVTWTKEPGFTCVYSYDPSAVTGTTEQSNAWKAKWCVQGSAGWATACSVDGDCGTGTPKCRLIPKGFRDTNGGWDTVTLGAPNGLDPYHRLGETGLDLDYDGVADTLEDQCPCGDTADGQNKLTNIDAVPGSYTYDTSGASPKVYVSTRRTCSGGIQAGYTCYGNADCPGSTCGSCTSPTNMYAATHASLYNDGSPTPPFQFLKAYTVVRNLVLDSGAYHGPGNGFPDHRAVNFGASNALYDNIEVRSGVASFQMAPGGTPLVDTTWENNRWLSGSRCSPTTSPLSGVTINRQEIRGTSNTLFNCQTAVGASSTDRINITRGYFHRNFSNLGSSTCGSQADRQSWNCSTKYFAADSWKWTTGHGVFWGDQTQDSEICNTKWENNLFELIGGPGNNDALQLAGSKAKANYTGCTDNIVAYNTFVNQQASNRALGIEIGSTPTGTNTDTTSRDNTFVSGLKAYGNAFITDWSSAQSASCIFRNANTTTSKITSDYNAFIYPAWDANGGGSTQNNSSRIWNSGETLASVITTTGQESHSLMTCADGCSAASPGTHFNSTLTQVTDAYSYDFTPSNPTPITEGKLVNAGAPVGIYPCPSVDFYGNPRNDGSCDIGAVEAQTPAPTVLFQCNFDGPGSTAAQRWINCGGTAGTDFTNNAQLVASPWGQAAHWQKSFGFGVITADIIDSPEVTLLYRERYDRWPIADAFSKGVRPYYSHGGGANYMAAIQSAHSPDAWYQSTWDRAVLVPTSKVTGVDTRPDYCPPAGGGTYVCGDTGDGAGRLRVVWTPSWGTTWHLIRIYIKMPTSEAASDGLVKVWIDEEELYTLRDIKKAADGGALSTDIIDWFPSEGSSDGDYGHELDEVIVYQGSVPPSATGPVSTSTKIKGNVRIRGLGTKVK